MWDALLPIISKMIQCYHRRISWQKQKHPQDRYIVGQPELGLFKSETFQRETDKRGFWILSNNDIYIDHTILWPENRKNVNWSIYRPLKTTECVNTQKRSKKTLPPPRMDIGRYSISTIVVWIG